MNEKIKSVSEAFSMQPKLWLVGDIPDHDIRKIEKIVEEDVYDTGDPFSCYVGYFEGGGKAFHIRKQCATVTYF